MPVLGLPPAELARRAKAKKLKALGINIYGGGFTLGVLHHFDVIGQWEEINLGRRTFDLNFGGRIPRPLKREEWQPHDLTGKVHLVYANPPCAPWSMANTHVGKTKASRFLDKRLALTKHTYEAALTMRPDVFISESVEAGYNIGASHYDQYVEMWMRAGYAVTFFLSDAILQGAPCTRRRFHFIAHRHKLQLGSPPSLMRPTIVADAIQDLVEIRGQVPLHQERKLNDGLLSLARQTAPGRSLRHTLAHLEDWRPHAINYQINSKHYPTGD